MESGQGQTINSYTNKPINKFKVHALLDDTLSCTHRVRVGLDNVTIFMGWALDIFTLVPSSVIQQYFVMNHNQISLVISQVGQTGRENSPSVVFSALWEYVRPTCNIRKVKYSTLHVLYKTVAWFCFSAV